MEEYCAAMYVKEYDVYLFSMHRWTVQMCKEVSDGKATIILKGKIEYILQCVSHGSREVIYGKVITGKKC